MLCFGRLIVLLCSILYRRSALFKDIKSSKEICYRIVDEKNIDKKGDKNQYLAVE